MKKFFTPFFLVFVQCVTLHAQFAQQWVKTYDDLMHFDNLSSAITLNAAGSLIISGSTNDTLGQTTEIRTIKYDPSGNILWQKTYTPVYSSYYPADIITDPNGDIYIAIYVLDGAEVRIRLLKYSCNGDLIWDSEYPTVNPYSFSKVISLDDAGNIYIGGRSDCFNCDSLAQSNNGEATIAKFDNQGNYIREMRTGSVFTVQYIGALSSSLSDMIISGNKIYSITNLPQDSTPNQANITYNFGIARHDTSGTRDYLQRIGRPATDDFPVDLFLGSNEDIFITGWTKDTVSNSKKRSLTAKLDSSGNILYVKERGDTAWENEGFSVVADLSGNAYVAGRTFENGAKADIELIKYDPSGNELWVQIYNSTFNDWDNPVENSIYIDSLANIYINAYSSNGINNDFLVLKYDSSGILLEEYRYNGVSNMEDIPSKMIVNATGEIFNTGSSKSMNGTDYLTLKLGFPTTVTGDGLCTSIGVAELNNSEININVYPNPVSTELTVHCNESIQQLKIISVLGKVVYRTDNILTNPEIKIPCSDFHDGVYFIEVKTINKNTSKRFIKL